MGLPRGRGAVPAGLSGGERPGVDGGGPTQLYHPGLCPPFPHHRRVLRPAGQSAVLLLLLFVLGGGGGAASEPQGDPGLHRGVPGLLGALPRRPAGRRPHPAGGCAAKLRAGERHLCGTAPHAVFVASPLLLQPHPLQLPEQELPLRPDEGLHL